MPKELSVIAKGAVFIFAGFAASKVLAYIYKLVTSGLGPEEFGVFSLGIAIASLLEIFAAMGLYQGILHFAAVYDSTGKPEKARGTILTGLKVQLVTSLVSSAMLFLFANYISTTFFNDPQLAIVLQVYAILLPISVITSTLMILTQAFKKIEYKIYVRSVFENIAKIAFTLVLFYLGYRLFGIMLGLLLSAIVAFAISLYLVQKKVFPIFGKGLKSAGNLGELFHYSWPLLAMGFFYTILSTTDTIMLSSLSGVYDAGIYNVAHPTANLLTVAPTAFSTLFLPVITGLYAQKKFKEFEKTFKVVTRWTFSCVFPCLLFTMLFAQEILAAMFGNIYAVGAGALIILSIGIFAVTFEGSVRSVLESTKRTKLIFFNTVVSSCLNIVLNFFLIPLFGARGEAIIGASLATAFSYFLWNLLALVEVYQMEKVHPYGKEYSGAAIASFISIAIFFLAKPYLPSIPSLSEYQGFSLIGFALIAGLGISFLAIYAFLLILFKGLQPEDLEILKAAENKTGLRLPLIRNFVKRFSR